MSSQAQDEWLIDLRRDLHRHPEPAWREFYTTARLVDVLEWIGADEILIGPDVIDEHYRWGLPEDESEVERWFDRAIDDGADPEVLDQLAGGSTGLIGVIDRGPGPHVALRVDIDALFVEESDDPDHRPAREGFRSTRNEVMHACGHDAHATIGVGVLERIKASDFAGRFSVIFQPAEEEIGGGKSIVEGGYLDDVDDLFAIHVGLGVGSGEIVAGYERFLAVSNLTAEFIGAGAHAGARPQIGHNAVQALATATQNLYGISRSNEGVTRVNVGRVEGGTASNIIPPSARMEGEVRGETTELRDYMKTRATTVVESAAAMHDCDVELTFGPEAPGARSDAELADIVAVAAEEVDGVATIHPRYKFRGSEDATYLMRHVQDRGGRGCFVGIGTDHPGGHHTGTFDVDEESIRIGVDVVTRAVANVFAEN